MRALKGALFVFFVSCAAGDKPGGGEGGATTGGAATAGGSSGSANGGTSQGGDAGDDQAGSSGASQGGSSGTSQGGSGNGRGGSAGDGVAAAGGGDTEDGTVTGVVKTDYGSPNANVIVAIGSAITYTDADGRFEIPNVPPEYDLVVIVPPESYVLVLRGASARSLSLRAPGDESFNQAFMSGVVTGGVSAPLPMDCFARAAYVGSEFDVFSFFGEEAPLLETDASYVFDPNWYGPTSISGSLYALEFWVDAMNHPISYEGFGSKPLDLSRGVTYETPATTIALAPVASRTVSGTITVPEGYRAQEVRFTIGPFMTDLLYLPPETYSSLLPTGLTGLKNTVHLHTTKNDEEVSGTTYLIDDSVTTLDLATHAAAVSILPVPTAVVDYETEFSWEPPADSVSTLSFQFERWNVRLVTDASSATIPDLTEYGVSHLPGSQGYWSVLSDIGPTSVDEWVRFTADEAAYLMAHGRISSATGLGRAFTLAE